MAKKPLQSQWEFGELFAKPAAKAPAPPPELPPAPPVPPAPKVFTVSEITTSIRRVLEQGHRDVKVAGEITNLRIQSSGHAYFAIKDAGAQLSCVLFRGDARGMSRDLLVDGRMVVCSGDVTVYEPRGQYQLRVARVELQGIGALQAAFEELKRKLAAEGLFESGRKRPIPRYPTGVGIVTSATGAALRDVLHVFQRRDPRLRVVVAPCRVQGAGAAGEIAGAIADLNRLAVAERGIDLILVTRGGGSLEDLWAFNEEVVARAIHASALPVVSGVGHEIDFTIADFTADLRAATPSAAAELITEGIFSSREFVADSAELLGGRARRGLERREESLEWLAARLGRVHPRTLLERHSQRLDEVQDWLGGRWRVALKSKQAALQELSGRLRRVRPVEMLARRRLALEQLRVGVQSGARWGVETRRMQLSGLSSRLELLSPRSTLKRGYSITTFAESGKVVRSAGDVSPGARLKTVLADGEVQSVSTPAEPG